MIRHRYRVFGAIVVIGAGAAVLYWMSAPSAVPSTPSTSAWRSRLWKLQEQASQAHENRQWSRSESAYAELLTLLPTDPSAHYSRGEALAHLQRIDEALIEFREAVELGWSELEGLNEGTTFANVRAHAAFAEVVAAVSRVPGEDIAIYKPKDLSADSQAPLIIAFHGLGENPHRHIRGWQRAAEQIGAVVVAPRGIKRMPERRVLAFRWDTGSDVESGSALDACRLTLKSSIEFARRLAVIDPDRIMLAGYSQGGYVALKLLADGSVPVRGAMLQAPSYSERALQPWRPAAAIPVRVFIAAHELDRLRPLGEQAHHDLNRLGIESRLQLVAGYDHEIPPENESLQIEAIRYILSESPEQPSIPPVKGGT